MMSRRRCRRTAGRPQRLGGDWLAPRLIGPHGRSGGAKAPSRWPTPGVASGTRGQLLEWWVRVARRSSGLKRARTRVSHVRHPAQPLQRPPRLARIDTCVRPASGESLVYHGAHDVSRRGLYDPVTPRVPIAPTVMSIHEPVSRYYTNSDDEPSHVGQSCPVRPELMAPRRRTKRWVRKGLSRMVHVSCSSPWSTISQRRPTSPV